MMLVFFFIAACVLIGIRQEKYRLDLAWQVETFHDVVLSESAEGILDSLAASQAG